MKKQPTEEQKAAALERRKTLSGLARKVAAMSPEERARLIPGGGVSTIEGHPLSIKNSCLAIVQRPGVSLVGGFQQWRRAGRAVVKGEKSIGIFLPLAQPKGAEEAGEADGARPRFRVVSVFDITQTAPLETV